MKNSADKKSSTFKKLDQSSMKKVKGGFTPLHSNKIVENKAAGKATIAGGKAF